MKIKLKKLTLSTSALLVIASGASATDVRAQIIGAGANPGSVISGTYRQLGADNRVMTCQSGFNGSTAQGLYMGIAATIDYRWYRGIDSISIETRSRVSRALPVEVWMYHWEWRSWQRVGLGPHTVGTVMQTWWTGVWHANPYVNWSGVIHLQYRVQSRLAFTMDTDYVKVMVRPL